MVRSGGKNPSSEPLKKQKDKNKEKEELKKKKERMLLLILLLALSSSSPTQVLHSTFSTTEDAQGWVHFELDDLSKVTSIVLYKKMQDILYPTNGYTPFVYYTQGKVENLNDCKMDETTISLNTRAPPEFWTLNKAYIMITQQDVYNVIMLTNTKPTVKPTTQETTTQETTTQETTEESTTQESTTKESTTQESTTQESTTQESTTQESTTKESTTKESTTTEEPTREASNSDGHDVKSANTVSSGPQEWIPHKNIAIILLCAFTMLFLVLLVVVTFRKGSKQEGKDENDFFANHKSPNNDEDDFVVLDDPTKDMQILMALGKGAKPSFKANLYQP